MDFTDKLACSGPPPVFSPDRRLLASADGYRLVVRAADSLAVVSLASCLDRIEALAWSPDSDHILCGLLRRATVQVFCVSDPDWACSIAEGPAGVAAARWTPDGQHVLLAADFGLRLSVWSLVDQSCQYLRGAKHAAAGLAFSPDGAQLAVLHVSAAGRGLQGRGREGRGAEPLQATGWLAAEADTLPACLLPLPACGARTPVHRRLLKTPLKPPRHPPLSLPQRSDCKDSLAVYDCRTWQPRAQWGLPTADAADLAWSPDGSCLAVWESALHGHQLCVFTPEASGRGWAVGQLGWGAVHPPAGLGSSGLHWARAPPGRAWAPPLPAVCASPPLAAACPPAQGECLTTYSAYREMLGVKAVSWSPSGQLLALGDYEQVGGVGRGWRAEGGGSLGGGAGASALPPDSPLLPPTPAPAAVSQLPRPACPPPPARQGATVLNHVTWSPLAQFQHAPLISGPPSVVAYSEEVEEGPGGPQRPPLAVSWVAGWAGAWSVRLVCCARPRRRSSCCCGSPLPRIPPAARPRRPAGELAAAGRPRPVGGGQQGRRRAVAAGLARGVAGQGGGHLAHRLPHQALAGARGLAGGRAGCWHWWR